MFISLLVFGAAGSASLAIIALTPLVMRVSGNKSFDEREYQIFYKSGNYSLAFIVIGMVIINFISDQLIQGTRIGDMWLYFNLALLFFGKGLAGIIIYYKS